MECPQIIERNSRFYLLFSTTADFIAPSRRRGDLENIPWAGSFVMTAPQLLGPYRLPASGAMVTASLKPFPYACQSVQFRGRDYLLGTLLPEETKEPLSYISDPYPVEYTPTGIRLVQTP